VRNPPEHEHVQVAQVLLGLGVHHA
jgi:hypothetical protein